MGSVRLPAGKYSGISPEFAGDGTICEYAASVADGDVFTVGRGQLALVICDGKIMSLCGAEGAYVYDIKREPSCFTGTFPVSLNEVFRANRGIFNFTGEHRLIYFRMDEVCCTYRKEKENASDLHPDPMDRSIDSGSTDAGTYFISVSDPFLFLKNVAGYDTVRFGISDIERELNIEISAQLIGVSKEEADRVIPFAVSERWEKSRGIRMTCFKCE